MEIRQRIVDSVNQLEQRHLQKQTLHNKKAKQINFQKLWIRENETATYQQKEQSISYPGQ